MQKDITVTIYVKISELIQKIQNDYMIRPEDWKISVKLFTPGEFVSSIKPTVIKFDSFTIKSMS
jgi:hypothetical protein